MILFMLSNVNRTIYARLLLTGFILVSTISIEIACAPFEGLGRDGATGWSYPCGGLSQELRRLYVSSDLALLATLPGLVVRLILSYIISFAVTVIFQRVSKALGHSSVKSQ